MYWQWALVRSTSLLQNRVVEIFGSTGTISRFGERFRYGQYSLVTFLFLFYCRCPVPYGVGATFVGQFHTKMH